VSVSQPVERVVALLGEAGYERLPQPVRVAGIPFEFSAVLVAGSSLDLIAVVDTVTNTNLSSIRQRVEGLSRALDLVESRRSLTVVLIGPEPVQELQLALTRVARVLVAGVPTDTQDLQQAIAVLLPLELATLEQMPESWASAREKLLAAHPAAADLLQAAKFGSEEVAEAARRHLLNEIPSGGESR
jgi:hypothetical protein